MLVILSLLANNRVNNDNTDCTVLDTILLKNKFIANFSTVGKIHTFTMNIL